MQFKHDLAQEPEYNLYFSMKYIADFRERGAVIEARCESYSGWSLDRAEQQAHDTIDAILRRPLPEIQLWRERERIEAKLFQDYRRYTPFL